MLNPFGHENLTVLLDQVPDIRLTERTAILGTTTHCYESLVLTLGDVTSSFGHPESDRYAPDLKSLDDALLIRRRILLAFENAERESNPTARRRLMTLVVTGSYEELRRAAD